MSIYICKEWKKLIFWFVLEQPIREIEKQTKLSHYSVSKAVKLLRVVMTKDVSDVFEGEVEMVLKDSGDI